MGSLEFGSRDCVYVIVLLSCFFDVIVELHAMDKKLFNDFSHWKVNIDFSCNEGIFDS